MYYLNLPVLIPTFYKYLFFCTLLTMREERGGSSYDPAPFLQNLTERSQISKDTSAFVRLRREEVVSDWIPGSTRMKNQATPLNFSRSKT